MVRNVGFQYFTSCWRMITRLPEKLVIEPGPHACLVELVRTTRTESSSVSRRHWVWGGSSGGPQFKISASLVPI
jgi:hypothetical protein